MPAFGQDVKVDNNYVRITETSMVPDAVWETSASPSSRLLVGVGAGDVSIDQNGRREKQHWMPGHALWIGAGETLTLQNIGPAPLQLAEIAVKGPASSDPVVPNPKMDPVVIDPEHNVLVLDNEQIRVFRSWREPGATEKMHEHVGKGRIAVLLTGLDATVKTGDGSITLSHAAQGDVLWSGPVVHATTNLSSQKFEMLIVEVK
jgi:hypothetical protein